MTSEPWWLRDPGRLEREETELQSAGLAFRRDPPAFTRGIARLVVTLEGPSGPIEATATYPDAYPYFRPVVTGPDVGIDHHWNPTTGEYCLLEGSRWLPESDTLATLLTEQWSTLFTASAREGVSEDGELLEADQAEPLTRYMNYVPGSHLVLDLAPNLPDGTDEGGAAIFVSSEDPVRGFVANFLDGDSRPLLPEGVRFHAGPIPPMSARWVRLRQAPESPEADDIWSAVLAVAPKLAEGPWTPWPSAARQGKAAQYAELAQVVLVGLPEEVGRRQVGIGWCALLRKRRNLRKSPGPPELLRVARAGRSDLLERTPDVEAMTGKRVVLAGGGGLGSALVLMLAGLCLRELVMIDGDEVDAATGVRFPSALRFGGCSKTQALATLVCETQPYTNTERSMPVRIGVPRSLDGDTDLHHAVRERVEGADLVIDATADTPTQHYLSDLARQTGTAYLQAEATPGVWGGLVALYEPQSDACWMCLQHHLAKTLPAIAASEEQGVQPPGCGEPTYTGTGFDLATIAAHTARVAAAYLTGETGYGSFSENLFTVDLRDVDGRPLPAQWTGARLERHPDCTNPVAHRG